MFALKATAKSPPPEKMDVDLEDALDMAGVGKYQMFHCALMLTMLVAAVLEMIGLAFILPAAACDLDIPDNMKGIITSIPNMGIILTAPFWGRAADSLGRKPVMLVSNALAGSLGLVAAFMPGLLSFALCKLAASLFLSNASSLSFAYACELMPRRHRDRTVLMCNGLLTLFTTLSAVLAWAVLSSDWRYELGSLVLRPWRLLTAVYATPLILTAVCLLGCSESPKFLMTKRKDQEALNVVKRVYAVNTGLSRDRFAVKSLKGSSDDSGFELTPQGENQSALSLLRPPHLKWMALTGFLMFGLFSLLNGLYLFAPDTINKIMSAATDTGGSVCSIINSDDNVTTTESCTDSISHDTFHIMMVTSLVYGVLVTAGSLSPVTKKTLLVTMYIFVGLACLVSGITTNRILAGIAMSALQVAAMGIGPLTAYVVQMFPTNLRGTAVSAVMMLGRVGSAVGANAAGYFIAEACAPTFYAFTLLTFFCAALSFLLPRDKPSSDQ